MAPKIKAPKEPIVPDTQKDDPQSSPPPLDFLAEAESLFRMARGRMGRFMGLEDEVKALAEARECLDLLFRISNSRGR
jgi:hypothetical protein